jgi:arachidonate 15-lipoxygenase
MNEQGNLTERAGIPKLGLVDGLFWRLRKGFWNLLGLIKFRSNKPAVFPKPTGGGRPIVATPLASVAPGIPIQDILVADHVPADEAQPLKKLFYRFQLLMYRLLPAMQKRLPPVSDDQDKALDEAYDPSHRALFPAPQRPAELSQDSGADLAGLAVKGPFACYLERGTDDGFQWDFLYLDGYERHDGLYPLGVKVRFGVDKANGVLRAESITSALGVHGPADPEWRVASQMALCSASTHLSLVRHFNWVHLAAGGALAIATRNNLPPDHPLFRLLWPHIYGTQYSNEIVTEGQMVEGGDFPDTFSFTQRGMCNLFADSYKNYRLSTLDPAEDAERRGILGAGFATPSQDNLQSLFDVLHAHATRYVACYYDNDAAIARDAKVRAWVDDLNRLVPNGVGEIVPGEATREAVARLIGAFIYMASVVHEVVGAGVWNWQLWTDCIPVRMHRDGLREPLDVYQRLVNANFNLNVHRAMLAQDFSYLALDDKGRGLFKQFLAELNALDEEIAAEPWEAWRYRPAVLHANINA